VNKEISLLRRFKDRHIVQLIASETAQNGGKREAYLLLEYCPGGHLLSKLNNRNGIPLPLSDICRIFTQILDGVALMHDSSPVIIHRDLKLENILFSQDGLVKLCDFGSCAQGNTFLRSAEERSKAEEIISKETTQMYRAPEMVDLYMRDELTEKTDIWVCSPLLSLHHNSPSSFLDTRLSSYCSLITLSSLMSGVGMHPLLSLLHLSPIPRCGQSRHLERQIKFPSFSDRPSGDEYPDLSPP
jgi:serine/threonine protein kinase